MNVNTIVVGRAGMGQLTLSMVTRQESVEAAYAYAEAAIAQSPDLQVMDVRERPYNVPRGGSRPLG
jgi:hypothetical protein